MQIKRLELAGFKSFMNPVGLDFVGGITAILGPNGCGKSNVVDAMRWVLGEQSAKQLRGEKMMNVVFGGTKNRKPLGMAEVSVTFHNNQGRLPVAYDEVRITRRLSRDGESEYLLNGAPCRLKDIKDLITDTGAGSHAYSIIEREMVDGVINGHEDSRRFLFEEASGIMKYRMRRKEALRKLELTQQDLLRLHDIIEEIARQVRSLRRQMGRARRYQELQANLRRADTCLAQRRLQEYRREAEALQSDLDAMQAEGLGGDTLDASVGARIEALRTELVDTEHAHRAAGGCCEDLARQLKAAEEALLVLRGRRESTQESRAAAQREIEITQVRLQQVVEDRSGLESQRDEFASRLEDERAAFHARKEDLAGCEGRYEAARAELLRVKQRSFDFAQDSAARRSEIDLLRARLEAHEQRAAELRADLDGERERSARLGDEHSGLCGQMTALEGQQEMQRAALEETSRRMAELEMEIDARRTQRSDHAARLEAVRSRCDLLRAMLQAYEGYGEGARTLLERHAHGGAVLGTLAEHVAAPAGLEAAFDVLLHDVLDALLVRDAESGVALLHELRNERLGRATLLLPKDERGGSLEDLRTACAGVPGVIGLALDLLPDPGAAGAVLQHLLARAVLVEDADAARAVLAACGDADLRLATRDGVLFCGHGSLYGGSEPDRDVGLLGRRHRLQELDGEMGSVQEHLKDLVRQLQGLEAELQALRHRRAELELDARRDATEHHRLSLQRAALETSLAEMASQRTQHETALGQVGSEMAQLQARLPELATSAERLSQEEGVHSRTLAECETAFAALEHERDHLRLEVGELRVAYVTLQGEAESRARQLERLAELERELGELCARRLDEIARADQDLERYAGALEETGRNAADLAQRLQAARAAQDEVGLRLDVQRAALDAEQQKLHEIEKSRREQQGRRHAAEMALSECRMRTQNLVERVQENYGMNADDLLQAVFDWSDDDPVPDDGTLRQLRDEIARLGPVNLLALEEYEEKSTRLRFLEEQGDDLAKASTSLQETIEKINRTAHFLFMETFEQVRAYFCDTIRTVFDGGDGDLVLSNPEDPLETDIEILVRPRGKKIDTLTQLSSGERALTAIALLFSIYLVKPSPFCVFDEVDAPLDDANIRRFVALLQEFKDRTQFIVITHNKLTMEAADRLYGVTMEEEGVSKLVSVALDGELKGVPKPLRKKVQRLRAAAVLVPTAEALAGFQRRDALELVPPESDAPADGRHAAMLDAEALRAGAARGRAGRRGDLGPGNGGGNGHARAGNGEGQALDAEGNRHEGGTAAAARIDTADEADSELQQQVEAALTAELEQARERFEQRRDSDIMPADAGRDPEWIAAPEPPPGAEEPLV